MTGEKPVVTQWAIRLLDGKVYYACHWFFGIQDSNNRTIVQEECDEEDWWEIAQQLYAVGKGWVEL